MRPFLCRINLLRVPRNFPAVIHTYRDLTKVTGTCRQWVLISPIIVLLWHRPKLTSI